MPLLSRSANLEQLRKQAKELLREFHAGDSRARSRLAVHLPSPDAQTPTLTDDRCSGPPSACTGRPGAASATHGAPCAQLLCLQAESAPCR